MIRVFIADDHAIVRDGLRRLIDETPDLELAGETPHGWEVLRLAGAGDWDVLVLDLSLEDLSGVEVLRRLREEAPSLPVIVLSMYSESQYAVRLMKMGAAAYLSKGRSSDELLSAIRAAAGGKHYVTDTVGEALIEASRGGQSAPHEQLSEREFQVFMLISQGSTPGEIAAALGLAPSTVSSHLIHIRKKLKVRTNGEIIQYAYRAQLVNEAI